MVDGERSRNFADRGKGFERNLGEAGGTSESGVGTGEGHRGGQILGGGANLNVKPFRAGFENHVVLIGLRENSGHLALAEG